MVCLYFDVSGHNYNFIFVSQIAPHIKGAIETEPTPQGDNNYINEIVNFVRFPARNDTTFNIIVISSSRLINYY